MIDLSFTKDPDWIAQRELQWKEIDELVSEELTKREIERIRKYFFTGVLPRNGLASYYIIYFFPKLDVEGVLYCMNKCEEFDVSRRAFNEGFESAFFTGMGGEVNAPIPTQVELFKHVFTDTYQQGRKFPFLLGEETEYRDMTLTPDRMFSTAGYDLYVNLRHDEQSIWYYLVDYFFSLFPHVSEYFFSGNDLEDQVKDRCRSRVEGIMAMCFNPPEDLVNGDCKQQGLAFLSEFRERMDALENYPGDSKKVWERIKSENGA